MITRMREQPCVKCGYRLDSTTNVSRKERPTAGDLSICAECGFVTAFDDQLKRRLLTPEERQRVASDERIIQLQILIAGRTKS